MTAAPVRGGQDGGQNATENDGEPTATALAGSTAHAADAAGRSAGDLVSVDRLTRAITIVIR